MEKILVGVTPENDHLWAGIHALNLAKRIKAQVTFLLIFDPVKGKSKPLERKDAGQAVRKSLEAIIDQARSEGVQVEYYVAYGSYEYELVRFVKENKMSMLIIDSPVCDKEAAGNARDILENIRHQIDCRVEVVQEKGSDSACKRRR
jgi:nucleotide-binding universal stress UspA family protein